MLRLAAARAEKALPFHKFQLIFEAMPLCARHCLAPYSIKPFSVRHSLTALYGGKATLHLN
ncbi:MAG: hypothetical protein JWM21_3024 [Acidobacteria bacterium]|nr:hypothetical protein [Acidobacteriota bacterium]